MQATVAAATEKWDSSIVFGVPAQAASKDINVMSLVPVADVGTDSGVGVTDVSEVASAPAAATSVTKLVVDRVVAGFALILLAPLLIAIMLTVSLSSRGSALFRQHRVGRNGRLFTMLKFRTMRSGAESELRDLIELNEVDGGVLFKLHDDPRVTAVGRWLRRTSLDELPQLVNVLTGSMSLVGPRPQLPAEVVRSSPQARRRFAVRPGLTGLWQVSGRSDLSSDDALQLDLRYVDEWSLGLDAALLLRTFGAVVRAEGAY